MAKYRLSALGELSHQLILSPQRLRWRQLAGAEYLLDLIEPAKSYPYDFVCYHITGYRPRGTRRCGTLAGRNLIPDLVQLVEDLSGSPILDVDALPQSAWTTAQLAPRLGVSTKTICRWRRKGLAGRRLRFADGTVRIAFLDSAVRRFVARNLDMVRRGAAFTQLTAAEKRNIVERARVLLAEQRVRLHELSQRLAAETGRAVETVRYTLRRHDREHPAEALFGAGDQPVVQPEHQALFEAYQSGVATRELARRSGRSATAVEAILREVRARHLLARPLAYVYSHEFDAPLADTTILADPAPEDEAEADDRKLATRVPRDLPPYLQDLYRQPLLTPRQERWYFRQYNYLKFAAARLRKELDPLTATEAQLDEIESLLASAETVKNRIIAANLRLVVSVARRHVGRSPEFLEIVSDGNMSLMRAVEKFDYTRGYKFSTYATWAIMRNYARTIPETLYQAGRAQAGDPELLETLPDRGEAVHEKVDRAQVRRTLEAGLAQLGERERAVIQRHFGLATGGKAETLDAIGRGFGVTKERVRQIERRAIKQLREVLAGQGVALAPDAG